VAESERDALVARLARYPVERYPVQHATTQFHLGSLLLETGQTGSALEALVSAREVFARIGMRLEQAKATVMLGAALRAVGRRRDAAAAFSQAGAELAALDRGAEQAAASYNLGLVLAEGGDLAAAQFAWTSARELFLATGHHAQAAAAAREHGASLLAAGDIDAAHVLLQQAMELAERAGDEPGVGAAANAAGLAHLAAGEPSAAIVALRRAQAAYPRTLRPAEHAMVKANLGLAYEQADDRPRARLAAGQALAVPDAAAPVRSQAQQLLARLPGRTAADLLYVLDREDTEHWVPVVRDEMIRVVELPADERRAVVRELMDGLIARAAASYDVARALLEVVLEQPPRTYDVLISAINAACSHRPEDEADRLRAVIGSAMARFALPQWQRLAASLNAAAQATGEPATWR